MSKPVAAVGVFVVLMGATLGLFPEWFFQVTDWESRRGLLIAAGIRIVSGLMLILGASASRYPLGLRIFGIVVLLAGLVLVVFPLDLWAHLISWVTHRPAFVRVGGGIGAPLLGLFLIHAARPRQSVA